MTAVRSRIRLKKKMQRELVNAGVEGYPHQKLILKCRTKLWSVDDLKEILEDWRARGLVQKFTVKLATSKRPVTIWRATKAILVERL